MRKKSRKESPEQGTLFDQVPVPEVASPGAGGASPPPAAAAPASEGASSASVIIATERIEKRRTAESAEEEGEQEEVFAARVGGEAVAERTGTSGATEDRGVPAASVPLASTVTGGPDSERSGEGTNDPTFVKALAILRGESGAAPPAPEPPTPSGRSPLPEPIPARMLNEFVYCPRLFYYEHVEGVFVESADTVRGAAIHRRVDSGKGDLPPAANRTAKEPMADAASTTAATSGVEAERPDPELQPEVIHSRSVTLGSERLGVVAKLDLVEVRGGKDGGEGGEGGDLFQAHEVVPVDYKAGAPREGVDANELWPTDQMQLGLQILLLREAGYACSEGVIYYRATKQRVRFVLTEEREAWVRSQIDFARQTIRGPMPPPLVGSPKCRRCSLAPVCLPDETVLLASRVGAVRAEPAPDGGEGESPGAGGNSPRRLMAARDDKRALYLNTPGLRVGRKDEVLTIKDQDTVIDEVRMNDVSHVALFGNIQLTTQAIQGLCDAEIPVTYFSGGGWFYGLTHGHGLKNVFLRIEQFRLARDAGFALRLARAFVNGKIRNHRTMLMRNHVDAPTAALNRLREAARDASSAESLEQLLGIEGAAAATYFEHFGGMLKFEDPADDAIPGAEPPRNSEKNRQLTFDFHTRHRRPPTDPVNALLSLAYSMLAKDCTIAVAAVGFDPYVGFYHQPRFGRPALALDLMEEFRPLVAESAVLTAINNRVLNPTDFVSAGPAVNLSPAGRKKFFLAYEQRMTGLLTHPLFDYKVSYRRALEVQARILARTLTGEIPEYVPLTTR